MPQTWLRGSIIAEDGTNVQFYFNPQIIKITKQVRWNTLEAAGREQGIIQYGCADPRSFEFDVDLTRAGGDNYVKDTTEKLFKMTKPSIRGSGVDRPPKVRLIMGDAVKANCVLDSVSSSYGPLYNPMSLGPYSGKLTLKLSEILE